jgi:hypothetical protein
MTPFTQKFLSLAVAAACATPACGDTSDDSITIYSSLQPGAVSPELYRPVAGRGGQGQVPGYAIVRHDRRYDIERGLNPLRVTDVAALIDPTTVSFASLTEPRTTVAEQSFQFDLVSQAKLLQRFIGERITIEQPVGDDIRLVEGTLIGATDGLTLQLDDGSVQAMRSYGNIRFPDLPGGLITRPTLEWLLDSPRSGEQNTRVAYETKGMTWWADYNITLDESKGCRMDLNPWVSVINRSGASFENARLKLIAGDVNRAEMPDNRREVLMRTAMMEDMAAAPAFEEKAFFEYHLYTLQRRTDLPDNSTKQIQLFPTARGIECEKELVFAPTLNWGWRGGYQLEQNYGHFGKGDVNVYLRFRNDEENGLGVPLPAGRIRVNQLDPADGSLEFIGEDTLDHTPRNEEVLIEMGEAFDVVGERKQTDFEVDTRGHHLWESFEIKLRNQKDETTRVVVLENLYRMANWEIEDSSHRFTKDNSNRIRFEVEIPPEKEVILTYRVHYTW